MTISLREKLLDHIANQITGAVAATCCFKSGGWGGKYAHPNCDCREVAENILKLVSPMPIEWVPERVGGFSSTCDIYYITEENELWVNENRISDTGSKYTLEEVKQRAEEIRFRLWWEATELGSKILST